MPDELWTTAEPPVMIAEQTVPGTSVVFENQPSGTQVTLLVAAVGPGGTSEEGASSAVNIE